MAEPRDQCLRGPFEIVHTNRDVLGPCREPAKSGDRNDRRRPRINLPRGEDARSAESRESKFIIVEADAMESSLRMDGDPGVARLAVYGAAGPRLRIP